jgi:hypothetical protein
MSFEKSKLEGSPHHFFTQIAGNWAGKTRTWLEPLGRPVESNIQGSLQLVLDGRFAIYIYQSSLDDEPLQGMFIFGYNTNLDRYEASWIDSYHTHTGIMFCTGESRERGFWVRGSYPDPAGGPEWDWRTEVVLLDDDQLSITAYNISPEGQEAKAVESQLVRLKKLEK